MVDAHCSHCDEHNGRLEQLEDVVKFLSAGLRFVAVSAPIVLGVASFVVLVTR